uniref:Zinc finger protein 629 isoform X3 n=1 Tax=Austrofundulus limnaeus TaxID=52670 RepID=A0A2I4CBW1_AUSLI
MSSVHYLREYIGERLTAAAAEIFSEFEKTILRYEEEIDRQRRLLDLCWKPELKLHRVEQDPVHETPFLTDQQEELLEQPPWIKEEQDEAEPVEIKAEEEELCTGEEEYHLVTTVPEDYSEPEPDRDQLTCQSPAGPRDQDQDSGSNENEDQSPKKTERTACYHDLQQEPVHKPELVLTDLRLCSQRRKCSLDQKEPEPPQIEADQQQLCRGQEADPLMATRSISLSPAGPEDQDQGSGWNEQTEHTDCHHGNKAAAPERLFSCKICGETFLQNSLRIRHIKVHKVWSQNWDKLLHCCPTCGKKFPSYSHLVTHMRVHTGEKPFSCLFCGKRFNQTSSLNRHMKVH